MKNFIAIEGHRCEVIVTDVRPISTRRQLILAKVETFNLIILMDSIAAMLTSIEENQRVNYRTGKQEKVHVVQLTLERAPRDWIGAAEGHGKWQ